MNDFGSIHSQFRRFSKHFSLASLANGDVSAEIVHCIVKTCANAATRASPLSRQAVFWLQLGMALFRDLSIPDVFSRLIADCRGSRLDLPLRPVTCGALAHARARLGIAPFKEFFESMAARVEPVPSFHGLAVWAIDGMRINLPDQPANEALFGRPPGSARSGYPQLHLVTLICTMTHQIRAATWGRVPPDERGSATELIPHLGPRDLLLMDRGIYAAWLVDDVLKRGSQFLARVTRSVKPTVLRERSPGDYDVLISPRTRKGRGNRTRRKVSIEARMIEFTVSGVHHRILTSLMDPAITKQDLAELYLERWEVEISNAEFKCKLTPAPSGSAPTHFRGRSPDTVLQELYATLAVYNLVRGLMVRGAERAGVSARKISFVKTLRVIRDCSAATATASPSRRAVLYDRLIDDIAACVMRRPRRQRTAPRSVKCARKRYRSKRIGDRCTERPSPEIAWGVAT